MPSAAPNTAIMMDSSRTMRRSCRREIPIARSSPISRVRSITDSARVLMTPTAAMITDMTSRIVRNVTNPSICLRASSFSDAWSDTFRFG